MSKLDINQAHKHASFEIPDADHKLVTKIVERAVRAKLIEKQDTMDVQMDLIACHANGTPLKLEALLDAPDFDFAHDVYGISRHISRTTGVIGDCFLPRCAQPGKARTNG